MSPRVSYAAAGRVGAAGCGRAGRRAQVAHRLQLDRLVAGGSQLRGAQCATAVHEAPWKAKRRVKRSVTEREASLWVAKRHCGWPAREETRHRRGNPAWTAKPCIDRETRHRQGNPALTGKPCIDRETRHRQGNPALTGKPGIERETRHWGSERCARAYARMQGRLTGAVRSAPEMQAMCRDMRDAGGRMFTMMTTQAGARLCTRSISFFSRAALHSTTKRRQWSGLRLRLRIPGSGSEFQAQVQKSRLRLRIPGSGTGSGPG